MSQSEKPNLLTRANLELGLYALLLLLAAALRLWGLGLRPLSAGESEHALAAWQLYRGLDYAPQEPLYLLSTLCSFGLFGVSDAAARFAPALAGTVLVALPALLRRQLGRVGALAAATLLAVSPTFVFLSDSANGATLAVAAGLLLVAGSWRYRESATPTDLYLAAVGLGLALTAGPAAYPLILVLAAFAAVFLVTGHAPRPDRPLLIRAGLLCGGVLAVAGTVALTRLDGLQEVLVNEPGRWLATFVAPRLVPWEHALRLLALYDLAALVLGVMAMGFLLAQPVWLVEISPLSLTGTMVRRSRGGAGGEGRGEGRGEEAPSPSQGEGRGGGRGPFAVFLVLWALIAFLLASLAGATSATATQSASVVLPLILLAGSFVNQLLVEGLTWTRTRGLLVVFVVAFVYVAWALVRLVVWQDQSGSEFIFAAGFVIVAVTVIYWTWAARPRWLGLAVVGLVLLVLSLHGATYLIHPPATGPREFLVAQPTSTDVRLLLADLDETAFRHQKTDWAGLDVTVIGAEGPAWGWLLRDQGRVTFVERPGDDQPRVIIAPLEWQETLDETLTNYQRCQYTLGTPWSGVAFDWDAFVEWLLYRHSAVPPDNHEFVVYIRQ